MLDATCSVWIGARSLRQRLEGGAAGGVRIGAPFDLARHPGLGRALATAGAIGADLRSRSARVSWSALREGPRWVGSVIFCLHRMWHRGRRASAPGKFVGCPAHGGKARPRPFVVCHLLDGVAEPETWRSDSRSTSCQTLHLGRAETGSMAAVAIRLRHAGAAGKEPSTSRTRGLPMPIPKTSDAFEGATSPRPRREAQPLDVWSPHVAGGDPRARRWTIPPRQYGPGIRRWRAPALRAGEETFRPGRSGDRARVQCQVGKRISVSAIDGLLLLRNRRLAKAQLRGLRRVRGQRTISNPPFALVARFRRSLEPALEPPRRSP